MIYAAVSPFVTREAIWISQVESLLRKFISCFLDHSSFESFGQKQKLMIIAGGEVFTDNFFIFV